ncbi:hypothetical protein AXG89_02110 [Burkholderia sp. PAMC 26561]|nr:hypothetical protein AXG89_02110 [Burkholderia sp. PAMC 26561]
MVSRKEESELTEKTEIVSGDLGRSPESLEILAKYLEQSLDNAETILMVRYEDSVCTVYLGDPSGPRDELRKIATIAVSLANEMLELTRSGENQLSIGGQNYRFVRSFATVGVSAAIVFFAG